MGTGLELLRNALILDSETFGLERGAPVHEFAILDVEKQIVREYILSPQRVRILDPDLAQETTGLAATRHDRLVAEAYAGWPEAVSQYLHEGRPTDTQFVRRAIEAGTYPHLLGKTDDPLRPRAFQSLGMRAQLGTRVETNQFFLKTLPELTAGKTLWFANARFESKMVGAHLGAAVQAGARNQLLTQLETHNPQNHDPFYVTGREVNIARTKARVTGDWSGVWRAYKNNPAKPGQTAVRDIQDVLKAVVSMSRQAGLMPERRGFFGLNMDMAYRLIGSTQTARARALDALGFDEAHRAAEDAAISQRLVLERAVPWAEALESLLEGRSSASSLKGPLSEIADWAARMDAVSPHMVREALASRFARAETDLAEQGRTFQTQGIESIRQMRQLGPEGDVQYLPRAQARRVGMSSMDEVADWLEADGLYSDYGVNVRDEYQRYLDFVGPVKDPVARVKRAQLWHGQHKGSAGKWVAENASELLAMSGHRRLSELRTTGGAQALGKAIKNLPMAGRGFAWAAGAATVLGGLGQLAGRRHEQSQRPNLVATTYDQWVMARAAMQTGGYQSTHPQNPVHQGFPTQGFVAENRRARTDFGSPYRGPQVTNQVFVDQELQREREVWMRRQYGATHFDPQTGLFGFFGPFKDLLPRGYRYLQDGTPVPDGFQAVRGRGLLGLDLGTGKWKVEAEDADTVVVKRGGIRGAMASMFGLNRGYSFRLAGVDSPETSHGAQSYHAPQPGAEASAEALRSLIRGSRDLQLVYDPANTTYGRMMGVLIKDGKNLNFEIVRKGLAAHLPYGKSSEAMLDYRAMDKMESAAIEANRGIWQHPWARSFAAASDAAGFRTTFNVLAKKKRIVENASRMQMLSLMEQAQSQGMYTNADAQAAAQVGKLMRMGKDRVRPHFLEAKSSSYANWNYQMASDLRNFVRTKGTNSNPNHYSRTSGYGKLDGALVLDSLGASNHIVSRRQSSMSSIYGKYNRQRLQAGQRQANKFMNRNPINHYQM